MSPDESTSRLSRKYSCPVMTASVALSAIGQRLILGEGGNRVNGVRRGTIPRPGGGGGGGGGGGDPRGAPRGRSRCLARWSGRPRPPPRRRARCRGRSARA